MAAQFTTSFNDMEKRLSKKYGIKRPCYDEEDLKKLKTNIDEDFSKNPLWKRSWCDENLLIRFLKANSNVEKAVGKLNVYFDWKLECDSKNISPHDADIINEESQGRSVIVSNTRDRCGRPIMLVFVRKHDKNHGNYESLFKFVIYQLEELCKQADENEFKSFDLVFDLNGFSMRNMDFQYVQTFLQYLKEYYPERLGVAFIINYPFIFYACWKIIKLWLNDVIKSRILFADKSSLNDFMDIKQLPGDLFP
ncbi:uncharacterized protein LOC130655778 [Hydractinia symbiolongicarpus]|uniref:uncharacterized protein LOC130655778 n=1 Tax=Hydractinia symbiolongicarpus TaxID=13093 RepID=UPI00254C8333|nr:uncharacterized protein LOC130655778 [Hydractinia symbiolongicarpus]